MTLLSQHDEKSMDCLENLARFRSKNVPTDPLSQ
jgi:hypothetical protein